MLNLGPIAENPDATDVAEASASAAVPEREMRSRLRRCCGSEFANSISTRLHHDTELRCRSAARRYGVVAMTPRDELHDG
jgi:hypothetical protein